MSRFGKDIQYWKFCLYGFLKNQRFFEPFFILFLLEKDFTFLEIGLIYSIREITRNVFEIPAGFIADALGRRKTMILSFSIYILSFLLYYIAARYYLVVVATIAFALGDAFRTGTHKAMIFDYLQIRGWSDQKVHYYGHTRSWSQIGSAASSLLAAAFVFFSGTYNTIFLFTCIPYLLGLFLMLSYPSYLDGNTKDWARGAIAKRFKTVGKEFIDSFRNPVLFKALVNISSFSGYYRAIKDYLQPVIVAMVLVLPFFEGLEESKRTSVFIGLIYFIIYLLTSFASRNSGRFSDQFKNIGRPLNFTLFFGLVIGIFIGLLYTIDLVVISVILFLIIYLVENIRLPIGVSYIGENIKNEILATALSAESQSKTIFSATLAFLLGALADWVGIGMALMVISAVLLFILPLFWISGKK